MTDKPQTDPIVHNVVATALLSKKIDLRTLAMKAQNAEYRPKRFSAVILRILDPKATVLVFASGKLVITGARDEGSAKTAAKKILKVIQKCGFSDLNISVCYTHLPLKHSLVYDILKVTTDGVGLEPRKGVFVNAHP